MDNTPQPEAPYTSVPQQNTPVSSTNPLALAAGSSIVCLLIGGVIGYSSYPLANQTNSNPIPQAEAPIEENLVVDTAEAEPPFCNEYGTYEIPAEELLEKYTTIAGDTIRDVSTKNLGDESRAVELIEQNPVLQRYEVDDILPMNLELFIPNEKYSSEGITNYLTARGNISLNAEKPMFGVSGPNSGTGPFVISEAIKSDLEGISDGNCVEVIYGSRGFDPQKVVFEVLVQE